MVIFPCVLIIGIDLLTGSHLLHLIATHQCSNPNPIILDALPHIWNNTLLIVSFIAAHLVYFTFDIYNGLKDLLKHDKDALLRALGAVSYNDFRDDDPEDPDYQLPNRFD